MENLKITNQNVDSVLAIKNKIQGDGEFEDNKFPPNADSVLGIKDVSYPDANTDIRGKALSAIKVKEGDIEWKHTKEI